MDDPANYSPVTDHYSPKFGSAELRQRLEPAEQVLLARHADDLITELAVLEKEERGDRPDVVFHREALVLVDVHFRDLHRARFFLRDLVDERRDHFAWAAPFGPEIDQHGLRALSYFLVKIRIVQSDCNRVVHPLRYDV